MATRTTKTKKETKTTPATKIVKETKTATKNFQWDVSHAGKQAVVSANTQIGARKAAAKKWGYKASFPMAMIKASIKR